MQTFHNYAWASAGARWIDLLVLNFYCLSVIYRVLHATKWIKSTAAGDSQLRLWTSLYLDGTLYLRGFPRYGWSKEIYIRVEAQSVKLICILLWSPAFSGSSIKYSSEDLSQHVWMKIYCIPNVLVSPKYGFSIKSIKPWEMF